MNVSESIYQIPILDYFKALLSGKWNNLQSKLTHSIASVIRTQPQCLASIETCPPHQRGDPPTRNNPLLAIATCLNCTFNRKTHSIYEVEPLHSELLAAKQKSHLIGAVQLLPVCVSVVQHDCSTCWYLLVEFNRKPESRWKVHQLRFDVCHQSNQTPR